MAREFWKVFRQTGLFDAEMIRNGWWMLLLIIGTIAIFFVICAILVARYHP